MRRKLLLGVGPWVVFSLVLRFGSLHAITIAWIVFFVLQFTFGLKYFKALNPLSYVSLLLFAFLFLNSLNLWFLWGIVYAAPICYGAFTLTALVSVLVNRPFTLTHARMQTPREFWQHPVFLTINKHLSLFWAAAFAVNCIAMLFEHQVLWLSLIVTYVVLGSAIWFTERYPAYYRERAKKRRETTTVVPTENLGSTV